MTHLWFRKADIQMPDRVRKTHFKCGRCGKEVVGKTPSQTERCGQRFGK